jgi:hypothetical protein
MLRAAVWAAAIAGVLADETGSLTRLDGKYFDSKSVEARLTLECNKAGPTETSEMKTCPERLRPFTVTEGRLVTFKMSGDALRHTDVLAWDPKLWAEMYFTRNASVYACKQGPLCMKRVVCSMKEEFWGLTSNSNGAVVYLDDDDCYHMTPDTGSWRPSYCFTPRTSVCVMCAPAPCTDAELQCRNGLVVESAAAGGVTSAIKDVNGRAARFSRPQCTKACPEGTWLTCTDEARCAYVSPGAETMGIVKSVSQERLAAGDELLKSARQRMELREKEIRQWVRQNKAATGLGGAGPGTDVPVSLELGVPFDTCYPCSLAGGLRHFGRRVSGDSALLEKGYLPFECPGGVEGPRECGVNEVSRVDNLTLASGRCGCRAGLYREGQSGCMPCPAGHLCVFGAGPEPCPLDTFSVAGSSACTACGKSAGMCAAHQALTRCSGVGAQTRDSRCVDCNDCEEVSGSLTYGAVPCLSVV